MQFAASTATPLSASSSSSSSSLFRTSFRSSWAGPPSHRRLRTERFAPPPAPHRARRRTAKGACRCGSSSSSSSASSSSSSSPNFPWSLLPWKRRANDEHHHHRRAMGQFNSREEKHESVRKIIDKVFNKFAGGEGDAKLSFQELYSAILLVYNDLNKHIPGPHHDPPSRDEVHDMLEEFDTNDNDLLDREEFAAFLEKFTKNIYTGVTKSLVIYSIAPLMAFVAKRATEELPRVGPVVRRIPNFVYATIVTTAVAIIGHQKTIED